ncbi:MAG: DUF4389 domain-containing protein [Parvibaculum sp.]|uniref:DUF4389 domain-containing protein n=1 Tax=Parvibaculum sp. TaxID=2024848 RepID=UPI003C75BE90
MSDTSTSSGAPSEPAADVSVQEPLWLRFVYMLVFGFFAHIAFSLALFLGVVQIVLLAIQKEKNEELLQFSRNLVQYVGECLTFIIFAREDKPFPLGKFPNVGD